MAVHIKREPALFTPETSGDESSVTAVAYQEEAAVTSQVIECSSHPAEASTAQRTPQEILRLTTENKFFQPCAGCSQYRVGRDVQLTFFDLAKGEACCSVCKNNHGSEAVIQVRRSSYHDVVRVSEITKIYDIGTIQPYWINNDRVVFLRPRPQPRPPRGCSFPASCGICSRQLMDAHSSYCSLQCKLRGVNGLSGDSAAQPLKDASAATALATAPPSPKAMDRTLPQWGKMRRRDAGIDPESSHTDEDNNKAQGAGFYSDEEADAGSATEEAAQLERLVTAVLYGSSSKRRKHTPVRSPLE